MKHGLFGGVTEMVYHIEVLLCMIAILSSRRVPVIIP